MHLGELIPRNARRAPDKLAVVSGATRLTYRVLNDRINRLANALLQLGLGRGDRVAMLADNGHQYLETNAAAAKAGLCIVPLNTRYKGREITGILDNVEPKVLIFGEAYREIVAAHRAAWTSVEHFVTLGGRMDGAADYEQLLAAAPASEPVIDVREDDLFSILFTSGTTGLPKGIMLSHRNLLANCGNILAGFDIDSRSIALNSLPMFFSASINCTVWPHLYVGGTLVLVEKFNPRAILETIQRERITFTQVVPTMLITLLEFPDVRQYDLSSLKTLAYGSAPMPVKRLREAVDLVGNVFVQGYGLSETTCICTTLSKEDHVVGEDATKARRLASCGRESLNVHLRVVREDGTEAAAGEVGEIIVRGDHVMLGYWRAPEATAQAIRGGWLYSGDLGHRDGDGYLYIVDRKKDIIISGGINISSKEVEEVLFMHPAVLEAAAIGVPDEKWGEAVRAVVVLRPGFDASEQEIVDFGKQYLADFKKPRSVVFIDQLPRNPNGKVQKTILRARYGNPAGQPASTT